MGDAELCLGSGCSVGQPGGPHPGCAWGWHCHSPGVAVTAPWECSRAAVLVPNKRSCCLQEPCFLSYRSQEVFREVASS